MFQKLRFKGEMDSIKDSTPLVLSITVDTGKPNAPRDTRGLPVIGIDVGINSLATLDTSKQYPNPRPLQRFQRLSVNNVKKEFLSYFKQKRWNVSIIGWLVSEMMTTEIVNIASVIGNPKDYTCLRILAKALSDCIRWVS